MSHPKIPYTPPPSLGHELGVLFGFAGAMVLAMSAYLVVWQLGQRRSARKEAARRQELDQRGFTDGGLNAANEKSALGRGTNGIRGDAERIEREGDLEDGMA